jgi:RHS repeat-associated protein
VTWTPANYPEQIHQSATDYLAFTYGPDRQKVRRTVYEGGIAAKTVYYVGPHFEVELAGGVTFKRSHLFFDGREVFQRLTSSTGMLQEYFVHHDHLGSIDRLTLAGGSATTLDTSFSFDAFGKRRFDSWAADPGDQEIAANQWTEWGYSGHEHLDKVKLIHMNGRVQDPIIGRMLSPDPVLGDLGDPQSLNRYSYVRNNPLGLTDPTGFCETGSDSDDGCEVSAIVVTTTRKDPPPPPTHDQAVGGIQSWDETAQGGAQPGPTTDAQKQPTLSPVSQDTEKETEGKIVYNASPPRTVPPTGKTLDALKCVAKCSGLKQLVVTGGSEGKGHHPKSLHPQNKAVDIAGKSTNAVGDSKIKMCASSCGFTHGQYETFPGNSARDHWHFQIGEGLGVPALPSAESNN